MWHPHRRGKPMGKSTKTGRKDPKKGIAETNEITSLTSIQEREKWAGRQVKPNQRRIDRDKLQW